MSTVHKVLYPINYSDTDAGGVVYFANYLRFCEQARTDMFREVGISLREYGYNKSFGFVVKNANIDLSAPLTLDDILRIETVIVKMRASSIAYSQTMYNDNTNELIGTSESRVVAVVKENHAFFPDSIPEEILEKISIYRA